LREWLENAKHTRKVREGCAKFAKKSNATLVSQVLGGELPVSAAEFLRLCHLCLSDQLSKAAFFSWVVVSENPQCIGILW